VSDTPSSDKSPPSHAPQMIGSLVVAVLIVIVTIAIVTAKLGPGAELREDEERNEDRDNSGSGNRIDGGPVRWRLATEEMVVSGPPDGF
jgi:hypothetical protein